MLSTNRCNSVSEKSGLLFLMSNRSRHWSAVKCCRPAAETWRQCLSSKHCNCASDAKCCIPVSVTLSLPFPFSALGMVALFVANHTCLASITLVTHKTAYTPYGTNLVPYDPINPIHWRYPPLALPSIAGGARGARARAQRFCGAYGLGVTVDW